MISFNKGKRCCVFSILLLMQASFLQAQTKTFSLQDLTDSARKNLPALLNKKAQVLAAQAAVTGTRHTFLPQLKFGEQLNIASANSVAGSYFTFGITPSTSGSIRAEENAQPVVGNAAVLYSEYELVNFGLNNALLNNAKAYVDLAASDLQKEEYVVVLNVAKLYLGLLKNQSRLEADRQNIERYERIYAVIRALTLSGIKAGADSSLAKAELSKTKINYNQTAGLIRQLKEQLSFLTGVPAPGIVLDTLAITFADKKPNASVFIPDTIHNPLIDYYVKKKAVILAGRSVIKKTYLPKILLAGSIWARGSSIQYSDQYKALSNGLGYQRYNYAAGLAFTYNLFNSIYKKDKLAINRYQLQASENELQQQLSALGSAQRQADNAMQTLKDNLNELPVQLQSAQDTYQQKLAQYKAGLITLIDLTNASFVLYRSQTDYIESLNDWYQAQLDKAAATGNLLQFIQTLK